MLQVFYKLAPRLWKSAQDYADELRRKDCEQETSPTDVQTAEEREEYEHMHPHAQVRAAHPPAPPLQSLMSTP